MKLSIFFVLMVTIMMASLNTVSSWTYTKHNWPCVLEECKNFCKVNNFGEKVECKDDACLCTKV